MSSTDSPIAQTRPLVSVVTAAFNAEAFIADTVQSVRQQSLKDWEMLVVDDASGDATANIVHEISERDPRIHLIRLPRNSGVSAARNTALEQAKGRFIAFLDSDDLWLPQKLERQVAFMRERNAPISYTAFRRINEGGKRVGRIVRVPTQLTYRQLLKNTAIALLTSMIDTEKTGPIRIADAKHEDYVLWLSILKRGFVAHGLQEDLARYRLVSHSLSSKKKRSAAWVWDVYRKTEKLSPLHAAWCLAHYGTRALLKRLVF